MWPIDNQIRLRGPQATSCSGRVEIFNGGSWGTVCAPQSAHFGEGSGQIWLDNVACSGGERYLSECSHSGFGKHNCKHREDAGVICSGK